MKSFRSLLIILNMLLLWIAQPVQSGSCCGRFRQRDFDAASGVITITKEGTYQLGESVEGKVVINHDDVVFDLCDNKITNTFCPGNDLEGIEVNAGYKNTIIKNGVVESKCDRGIVVHANAGCCGPTLENLRVLNCAKEAVWFDHVKNGHIIGCEFISSSTGLVLDESEQVIVEDSVASCNFLAGFALHASRNNCFSKCKAFSNGAYIGNEGGIIIAIHLDRFGFVSTDGCGNVFQECCAENNTIPPLDSTDFCRSVAGFAFVGTETCSKIIDCKSENNWAPFAFDVFETHSLVKSATPYGILLKSKLHVVGDKELELVTAVDPGGDNTADIVRTVDWSPDGKYLAVGGTIKGTDAKDLRVYSFDGAHLTLIASVGPGGTESSPDDTSDVYTVAWSPDGKYLAVGGDIEAVDAKDLRVYTFEPAAHTPLTLLAAVNPADGFLADVVYSVDWSPDGKHLAVAGRINEQGGAEELRVYSFDPTAQEQLKFLASRTFTSESDEALSVNWSPDGKYVAVGGGKEINQTDSKDLVVYSFDAGIPYNPPTNNPLTLVASVDPGNESGGSGSDDLIWSVAWSPDGCFLAMGGNIIGGDEKDLRVYSFDLAASDTLVLIASVDPGDEPGGPGEYDEVYSVDWSPDGKHLAVGGRIYGADSKDLRVYSFDLSVSTTLTLLASGDPGDFSDPLDDIWSVRWSPDGKYLAVGGNIKNSDGSELEDLRIYKALDFPTKNVIKRNIVACNCIRPEANADECGCNLDVCPKGVGISGTSICNMIMENESYNNPFNYQFVTNVFDQRFGNMPSLLQNIALNGCEPVCIPFDCGRLQRENNVLLRRLLAHLEAYEPVIPS